MEAQADSLRHVRRRLLFAGVGALILVAAVVALAVTGRLPVHGVAADCGKGVTIADAVFNAAKPAIGDVVRFDTECNPAPDVLSRIEAASIEHGESQIVEATARGEAHHYAIGQWRFYVRFSDGSTIVLRGDVNEWSDLRVEAVTIER